MNFLRGIGVNVNELGAAVQTVRTAASAVTERYAQWKAPISPLQVVEVPDAHLKNGTKNSWKLLVSSGAGMEFCVYQENNDKESFFHIVYMRKKLSIFRTSVRNEAEQKLQHFAHQSFLFSHVDNEREVFDQLVEQVHRNPFWESIHYCCALGLVDILIQMCQSPNFDFAVWLNSPCSPQGQLPFHIATENDRLPIMEFLQSRGADLAKTDLNLRTAVHCAAAAGACNALNALSRDSQFVSVIDCKEASGLTPLGLAVRGSRADCVRLLLHLGADPLIPCNDQSLLQMAIASLTADDQRTNNTLMALIDAKPSLVCERYGPSRNTVLHYITDKWILHSILNGCGVRAKSSVDIENKEGETSLHLAAARGDINCAVTLLSFGAAIQVQDCRGNTALHIAVANGSISTVKCLLCFGSLVNIANGQGKVPSQIAAAIKDKSTREAVMACLHLYESEPRSIPNINSSSAKALDDFIQTLCLGEKCRAVIEAKNVNARGQKPAFVNLLSMDGGGIKGLVIIQIMIYIEEILKNDIWKKFDWVAGTSTGAILAAALSQGRSLRECQRLYFRFKDVVFKGSRPYDTNVLESFLKEEFGPTGTMAEITAPKLILTSALADKNPPKLILYRNYQLPLDTEQNRELHFEDPGKVLLWKAVRCSSAAPTYFASVDKKYVDGGLIANNPTLDLLSEVQLHNTAARYSSHAENCVEIGCVVSIGTGQAPPEPMESFDFSLPKGVLHFFSQAKSVVSLQNILVDQVTAAEGRPVDRARAWCNSIRVPFFRFSTPLSSNVLLDTTNDQALVNMLWDTEIYMRTRRSQDVRALVDYLHCK